MGQNLSSKMQMLVQYYGLHIFYIPRGSVSTQLRFGGMFS